MLEHNLYISPTSSPKPKRELTNEEKIFNKRIDTLNTEILLFSNAYRNQSKLTLLKNFGDICKEAHQILNDYNTRYPSTYKNYTNTLMNIKTFCENLQRVTEHNNNSHQSLDNDKSIELTGGLHSLQEMFSTLSYNLGNKAPRAIRVSLATMLLEAYNIAKSTSSFLVSTLSFEQEINKENNDNLTPRRQALKVF